MVWCTDTAGLRELGAGRIVSSNLFEVAHGHDVTAATVEKVSLFCPMITRAHTHTPELRPVTALPYRAHLCAFNSASSCLLILLMDFLFHAAESAVGSFGSLGRGSDDQQQATSSAHDFTLHSLLWRGCVVSTRGIFSLCSTNHSKMGVQRATCCGSLFPCVIFKSCATDLEQPGRPSVDPLNWQQILRDVGHMDV